MPVIIKFPKGRTLKRKIKSLLEILDATQVPSNSNNRLQHDEIIQSGVYINEGNVARKQECS